MSIEDKIRELRNKLCSHNWKSYNKSDIEYHIDMVFKELAELFDEELKDTVDNLRASIEWRGSEVMMIEEKNKEIDQLKNIYLSAVQGRKAFRLALKECREQNQQKDKQIANLKRRLDED